MLFFFFCPQFLALAQRHWHFLLKQKQTFYFLASLFRHTLCQLKTKVQCASALGGEQLRVFDLSLSLSLSSCVLWSDLLYGTTQVWVWLSTFPVPIIKAWSKYALSSRMVVAMATLKSPTSHHHPAPPLHQAAAGSGMSGFVVMLYIPTQTYRLRIKHYRSDSVFPAATVLQNTLQLLWIWCNFLQMKVKGIINRSSQTADIF